MELFDIEAHVESVVESRKKGINFATHIWLLGFHKLVNGLYLDKNLSEDYMDKKSKEYRPFTKLSSGNFMSDNISLIKLGRLYSVHLPVDNDYHLHFPLIEILNKGYKFFYEDCTDCRILEPYSFPYIELRQSVHLDDEMMDKNKGVIFYDNRISVNHQSKELITKSYKTIKDFVDTTKTK